MTPELLIILSTAFGVLLAVACMWLGWTARDKLGSAKGEPTVNVSHRHGGWEEPAVGDDTE